MIRRASTCRRVVMGVDTSALDADVASIADYIISLQNK
jgi:hypothetical protein